MLMLKQFFFMVATLFGLAITFTVTSDEFREFLLDFPLEFSVGVCATIVVVALLIVLKQPRSGTKG